MAKPAFHIPLTKLELLALGELTAIVGQIEWLLHQSAEHAWRAQPGGGQPHNRWPRKKHEEDLTLAPLAKKWSEHVRQLPLLPRFGKRAATLGVAIRQFAEDRNDFIHGVYAEAPSPGVLQFTSARAARERNRKPRIVRRSRTGATRPTSDIFKIRDQAALLSTQMQWFELHLMNEGLRVARALRRPERTL